jgi:hypothetical protein
VLSARSLLRPFDEAWHDAPLKTSRKVTVIREDDYVAVFHSIHRVMKAEKVLKAAGAAVLLIPVPRQLTSDCGLALRYDEEGRAQVEEILAREGLLPAELFRRCGQGYCGLEVEDRTE